MRLAADADVLLAAVLGGSAKRVLTHPSVERFYTTQHTFDEVREYVPILAHRKRLALEVLLLATASLPVEILSADEYGAARSAAEEMIAGRDPDDVEILALALHLEVPIWSNDNDFNGLAIKRFTTAQILRFLDAV